MFPYIFVPSKLRYKNPSKKASQVQAHGLYLVIALKERYTVKTRR